MAILEGDEIVRASGGSRRRRIVRSPSPIDPHEWNDTPDRRYYSLPRRSRTYGHELEKYEPKPSPLRRIRTSARSRPDTTMTPERRHSDVVYSYYDEEGSRSDSRRSSRRGLSPRSARLRRSTPNSKSSSRTSLTESEGEYVLPSVEQADDYPSKTAVEEVVSSPDRHRPRHRRKRENDIIIEEDSDIGEHDEVVEEAEIEVVEDDEDTEGDDEEEDEEDREVEVPRRRRRPSPDESNSPSRRSLERKDGSRSSGRREDGHRHHRHHHHHHDHHHHHHHRRSPHHSQHRPEHRRGVSSMIEDVTPSRVKQYVIEGDPRSTAECFWHRFNG
jgi:hypothetical protein